MAAYSKYTSNNFSMFQYFKSKFCTRERERERREGGEREGKMEGGREGGKERESKRKREKWRGTRGRGSERLCDRKEKNEDLIEERVYGECPHHCAKEAPKQMETQHVSCGTQPVASVFVPLY
jgi:hypothetical protein